MVEEQNLVGQLRGMIVPDWVSVAVRTGCALLSSRPWAIASCGLQLVGAFATCGCDCSGCFGSMFYAAFRSPKYPDILNFLSSSLVLR